MKHLFKNNQCLRCGCSVLWNIDDCFGITLDHKDEKYHETNCIGLIVQNLKEPRSPMLGPLYFDPNETGYSNVNGKVTEVHFVPARTGSWVCTVEFSDGRKEYPYVSSLAYSLEQQKEIKKLWFKK